MSDSQLEAAFLHWWDLLSPPGSPLPEREVELVPGRKFKCDFVWRAERVVVEVDGGTHAPGGGRHNSDKDREKINLLAAHGWRVFRYSGSMIRRDPQAVIEQVAKLIKAGGA